MEKSKDSEYFQSAADHLPSIADKLGADDLLYLYARFKQATIGPCNAPKPGLFDFQGRKKWNAWNDLGAMMESQAKSEYVMKLHTVDPAWGGKPEKKSMSGRSVSRMIDDSDDDVIADENILFQICKDGDVSKLKELQDCDCTVRDNDGRTLLHWACDRGHFEVVRFLLDHNCSVSDVDNEQSTPLHYASLCGYKDIVKILLEHGADPNAVDESGDTPIDCADSQDITELLRASKRCICTTTSAVYNRE